MLSRRCTVSPLFPRVGNSNLIFGTHTHAHTHAHTYRRAIAPCYRCVFSPVRSLRIAVSGYTLQRIYGYVVVVGTQLAGRATVWHRARFNQQLVGRLRESTVAKLAPPDRCDRSPGTGADTAASQRWQQEGSPRSVGLSGREAENSRRTEFNYDVVDTIWTLYYSGLERSGPAAGD